MYIDIHTFSYPPLQTLIKPLSKLLYPDHTIADERVKLITRTPFKESSTYPAEVITCSLNNKQILNLFCKYSTGTRYEFDSRDGVEYEAKVYDVVLDSLPLNKAKYYGICKLNEHNESLLILDFLSGSKSLEYTRGLKYFLEAAGWLAIFHSHKQKRVPSFIKIYDRDYYKDWADKALKYWMPTGLYPWLPEITEYYKGNCHILTDSNQSIIHGEFFPSNILVYQDEVCPIDWESAAIGNCLIDLACLIEKETVADSECIIEKYLATCFGLSDSLSESFQQQLIMAQMYVQFRYLLPKQKRKKIDMRQKRFARLFELGKKAGIF
ncbi:MAG: aminoglycoside phosphotransferase family protein [Bacteroidota bacterium]|nr:aminoglycoside phosphotransferase family protein [Bacteroidota bacterium]